MSPRSTRRVDPTLQVETELAAACGPGPRIVVGLDEVGRGALAGPVMIGACAVRIGGEEPTILPEGIRDSKMLSATRREALVAPIQETAVSWGIGAASPAEIDADGIAAALTTAALRALEAISVPIDVVLLDGSVDVLSAALADRGGPRPRVAVRVGADRDCLSVAAASVLAKVHRDTLMTVLDEDAPDYEWAKNKGYGSAAHREAILRLGPHEQHRRSWRLVPEQRPAPSSAPVPGPEAEPVPPAPSETAPRTASGTTTDAQGSRSDPGVLWSDDWPPMQRKETL